MDGTNGHGQHGRNAMPPTGMDWGQTRHPATWNVQRDEDACMGPASRRAALAVHVSRSHGTTALARKCSLRALNSSGSSLASPRLLDKSSRKLGWGCLANKPTLVCPSDGGSPPPCLRPRKPDLLPQSRNCNQAQPATEPHATGTSRAFFGVATYCAPVTGL